MKVVLQNDVIDSEILTDKIKVILLVETTAGQTLENGTTINVDPTNLTLELVQEEYNLILSKTSIGLTLLEEIAPIVVTVAQQGPPGASLNFEKYEEWVVPNGGMSLVQLSSVPVGNTLKFFVNGLKESSSLIEVTGQTAQFAPELITNLFEGDIVEFVYNYEV